MNTATAVEAATVGRPMPPTVSGGEALPMTTATACTGYRRPRRISSVLAATASSFPVWASTAHLDLTIHRNGTVQEIGPVAVVLSALFAGLAGWALLTLLERFTSRPRRNWTITAAVTLVLSLTGPLTQATNLTTTLALISMHLVVASVLIPSLARTSHN